MLGAIIAEILPTIPQSNSVKMPQPSHSLGFFMCGLRILRSGTEDFMWEEFAKAFCLMLVLEGVIPFLYPTRWRRLVASLAQISDRQLRFIGLGSMLMGAGLLYLIQ
jgi:uncharacterized protein